MAETLGDVSAVRKQSIARVELSTGAALAPDDWSLVAHFEDGLYDGDGNLIQPTVFGSRVVSRRFGDIKKTQISAAGVTVTVEQLAALIAAGVYAFRTEDIG